MKTLICFFIISLTFICCNPTSSTTFKIDFEDLTSINVKKPGIPPSPINIREHYGPGCIITEKVSGIKMYVLEFNYLNPPGTAKDGYIQIDTENMSGGAGNELHFNNACLGFEFPNPPKLKKVSMKFVDWGGNINFYENGKDYNKLDFKDIKSPTPDGFIIKLPLGMIEFSGTMNTFSYPGNLPPSLEDKDIKFSYIMGGGQETYIDDVEIFITN